MNAAKVDSFAVNCFFPHKYPNEYIEIPRATFAK